MFLLQESHKNIESNISIPDHKPIKLLLQLPLVLQKVHFVCSYQKCSQLEISLDSELSVEFSLVQLLPDKKLESKVDNM